MGLAKGMSNFRAKQEITVLENTKKVEDVLINLPKNMDKPSLSKVIYYVSEQTGLHVTTIKKNKDYLEMCENSYLNLMNVKSANNPKEVIELRRSLRTLELENSNLKNQLISLSNVVKRLEGSDAVSVSADGEKYKESLFAILEHFKEQLQVVDGEVIDPYSEARPKLICKI